MIRKVSSLESIGKRIARLRSENGWTQQSLAERLGISRVAVSLIESDISLPSERTLALVAGLLKIPPHELVHGSTYPQAKTDKLPLTVCSYTKLELELALLENDLAWLHRLKNTRLYNNLFFEIYHHWTERLAELSKITSDLNESNQITAAKEKLAAVYRQNHGL
jgi:transcriptional regulator with XRE-family HTH domain